SIRPIDKSWIDPEIFAYWKFKCEEEHGMVCYKLPWQSPTEERRVQASWLIDVRKACLVRPRGGETYVALSYVWGTEPFYTSLKENITLNQRPGAFVKGNPDIKPAISPTVLDAMKIVQLLDERYIWVDALCIVQDDWDQKEAEINNMADIYSDATLTIVAAQGAGAMTGMRGIKGHTQPRHAAEDWLRWDVDLCLARAQVDQTDPAYRRADMWGGRAWTYQEEMLSRRRLVFTENSVEWDCSAAKWHEDRVESQLQSEEFTSYTSIAQSTMGNRVPVLGSFQDVMLYHYNLRHLTFPEDALSAFAGCASVLSHSFMGGFVSGLPEVFFDLSLLWQPDLYVERRVAKNPGGAAICLPTWSWASFRGKLRQWNSSGGRRFVRVRRNGLKQMGDGEYVTTLVQWNYRSSVQGPDKPIHHVWSKWRDQCFSDSGGLVCPTGWSRHPLTQDSSQSPKAMAAPSSTATALPLPRCYFTQDESSSFYEYWWPIPLPDRGAPRESQRNIQFITCKTRRAWLSSGNAMRRNDAAATVIISLQTEGGLWAGALEVMEINLHDDIRSLLGQRYELVEVARGFISDWDKRDMDAMHSLSFWGKTTIDEETPGAEVYYVMWVVREGGIARRRGLGRVDKAIWVSLQREPVDLVL
ncbi:HET-domain-containing protein, partial [Cryphonectria parasitica EP155]